jgi:hypothetical protein
VPKALSVACLLGAFAAGSALAQQPARATYPPPPASLQPQRATAPGKVIRFQKPADAVAPVSGAGNEPVAQPAFPAGTGLPTIPVPVQNPAIGRVPVAALGGQKDEDKDKKKDPPVTPVKPPTPEEIAQYTKLESPERIFSMPDDEQLQRYIRDKMLKENPTADPKELRFPVIPPVGGTAAYVPKTGTYPPMQVTYDSTYVVHRRLHFEDKNTERYGWDLGIIQPAVSAFLFYKDVFLWPQSLASGCAYGFWDTNAGKCLPGSPTPYLLYPPGLTITGSVFEGVMVTGISFAIP